MLFSPLSFNVDGVGISTTEETDTAVVRGIAGKSLAILSQNSDDTENARIATGAAPWLLEANYTVMSAQPCK